MIKNLLEYLLISLLQKLFETLRNLRASFKIQIKIPIKLHIIKEMRWKKYISFLYKLNNLLNIPLILIMRIDMINQVIKQTLLTNLRIMLLQFTPSHKYHIVIGQPITLQPDIATELKDHLFVVYCCYVLSY